MAEVTNEIREVLDWILTEIGAGMRLFPNSPETEAWNGAHERCKSIIYDYRDGFGLFQMTARRSDGNTKPDVLAH